MMSDFIKIIAVMVFAGAVIWMADDAATNGDELSHEQRLYCEMVQIHSESNGNYGWPDFKQITEEVCE